jgi:hypothetical protein
MERVTLLDAGGQQSITLQVRNLTVARRAVEMRMQPTSLCGKPLQKRFRTLAHSDRVCRIVFDPRNTHLRRLYGPCRKSCVGRNGYAECAGGEGGRVYFVDTGGREIARRTINERRPPCRHYVRG